MARTKMKDETRKVLKSGSFVNSSEFCRTHYENRGNHILVPWSKKRKKGGGILFQFCRQDFGKGKTLGHDRWMVI